MPTTIGYYSIISNAAWLSDSVKVMTVQMLNIPSARSYIIIYMI